MAVLALSAFMFFLFAWEAVEIEDERMAIRGGRHDGGAEALGDEASG